MSLRIWQSRGGGPTSAMAVDGPCLLTEAGVAPTGGAPQTPGDAAVAVSPAVAAGGVAVIIVPDALAERLSCDGLLLAAGAHVVKHRGWLSWGDLRVWIAREESPIETTYDEAVHGPDAFCARTRGRVQPGEQIVICPGTAEAACGRIYKATAWLGMRCPLCGYDPTRQAWAPPIQRKGKLDELLQLAGASRRGRSRGAAV